MWLFITINNICITPIPLNHLQQGHYISLLLRIAINLISRWKFWPTYYENGSVTRNRGRLRNGLGEKILSSMWKHDEDVENTWFAKRLSVAVAALPVCQLTWGSCSAVDRWAMDRRAVTSRPLRCCVPVATSCWPKRELYTCDAKQ